MLFIVNLLIKTDSTVSCVPCMLDHVCYEPLPCCCRAEPNPIYCIQAKNDRMYLVRHGSSSATARCMNWA